MLRRLPIWRLVILAPIIFVSATETFEPKNQSWCKWAVGAEGVCDWMEEVDVETRCTFRVRGGLWTGNNVEEHGGPAIELTTPFGTSFIQPHNTSAASLPPRLLCIRRGQGELGLLKVVSSLSYLFRYWPYFVSSTEWASTNEFSLALWIGDLPDAIAWHVSKTCAASPESSTFHVKHKTSLSFYNGGDLFPIVSNHHVKILAAYALLNDHQLDGIFYADLDAYVPQDDATIDVKETFHAIHDNDQVDILFGHSTYRTFWRVKSSVFYLRDSQTARLLLATWLTERCGFKDQYSLWHSILKLAHDFGCLDYSGEMMKVPYAEDRDTFIRDNPGLSMRCKDRIHKCASFRFCSNDHVGYAGTAYHKSISSTSTRSLDFYLPNRTIFRSIFADGHPEYTDTKYLQHLGLLSLDSRVLK